MIWSVVKFLQKKKKFTIINLIIKKSFWWTHLPIYIFITISKVNEQYMNLFKDIQYQEEEEEENYACAKSTILKLFIYFFFLNK